jgi:hypothetical protein
MKEEKKQIVVEQRRRAGIDYDVASVVVRGRPHRCATPPPSPPPPSLSSFSARQPGSAGFDCGLKCWSVGLQNE